MVDMVAEVGRSSVVSEVDLVSSGGRGKIKL